MKSNLLRFIFGVAMLCAASSAHAAIYPPTCTPDSVTVQRMQDAAATCHPAAGDTVYGVRGIVIGFDKDFSPYAVWIQNGTGPYSGIQVFTGGSNYFNALPGTPTGGNLRLGDEVSVSGAYREFNNRSEIDGFDTSQSSNDHIIRRLSSFNPSPEPLVLTTAQMNWVPPTLPAVGIQEQYEGALVKIRGPLKVGRIPPGTGLGSRSFLMVTDPPTADSAAVDGFSLTNVNAPAVGTVIDSVVGIVDDVTINAVRSYRILLRSVDDLYAQLPPSVSAVYPIEDNKIRVVFDRAVTSGTAEFEGNYQLASFGLILDATFEAGSGGKVVILTIDNGLSDGDGEGLTISGITASGSGLTMGAPVPSTFTNGVLSIAAIQAPSAVGLGEVPCHDRTNFSTATGTNGPRTSFRGVAIGNFGPTLFYLMDPLVKGGNGQRSGIAVFGASQPLTYGHRYLVSGNIQEFDGVNTQTPAGETEAVALVYIQDEGLDPSINVIEKPEQRITSVCDLVTGTATATCDASQTLTNAEDYEGTLLKLTYARITENRAPGQSFFVAGPYPSYSCTLLVSNSGGAYTFDPDSAHTVTITGIITESAASTVKYRIQPRSNADIFDHGLNVGVTPSAIPAKVSFSAHPNPATRPSFTFALPQKAEVELSVFDLAGRKLAVVAKGSFDAGTYTRDWNGLSQDGKKTKAGMYFYRLKVGSETYRLSGIRLD